MLIRYYNDKVEWHTVTHAQTSGLGVTKFGTCPSWENDLFGSSVPPTGLS